MQYDQSTVDNVNTYTGEGLSGLVENMTIEILFFMIRSSFFILISNKWKNQKALVIANFLLRFSTHVKSNRNSNSSFSASVMRNLKKWAI